MGPKVNMDGDVAEILGRLAADAEMVIWRCDDCGIERGAKMGQGDVAQAKAYILRKKKKWWQFWIK
jgi:hypothetical protein